MATKNNPGQFDCYANAAPDEPMFILLGRDRHGPTLVRLWALLRAMDDESEAKVNEALACADAMDAHRKTLGKPPMPQSMIEALLFTATEKLEQHPEAYNESCACNLCQSYA